MLRQARCSLLISTYQAGKLIAVGVGENGLEFSMHQFDQVMGVASHGQRLAVGARGAVWFMADNPEIAPQLQPANVYDHCYLPRSSTVTGAIQCHELAYGVAEDGEPELWLVNTLFSCLVNLHPGFNFVPRWRPPFISQIAAEDRCHLNGVGMRDGRPSVVTVLARSDEPNGWRADKNTTGCVIDVATGEPITTGMAMPHSPRWHGGRLLALNSGYGTLEAVDEASGERTRIEGLPGFTRGLACIGNLAFVGLSRIRETAVFGGVPIAERHESLVCGVGVVDLLSGRTVASLHFESGIEEIFDVQLLQGHRCTTLAGNRPDRSDTGEIWVVPPGSETSLAPIAARSTVQAWLEDAGKAQTAGRTREAIAALRNALEARPGSAEIANRLGNLLQTVGDGLAATRAYRRAVAANPAFIPALQNLGYSLINQGATDEGLASLRRAQELNPSGITDAVIALALPVIYAHEKEVAARRDRLEANVQMMLDSGRTIDTTDQAVPTNFYCVYQGRNDRPVHQKLGRVFQGVDTTGGRGVRRDRERPRIGLLSAYFRAHTIGRLNLGRVQHLDRDRFDVVVLSAQESEDPMDQAFRDAAETFVHVPHEIGAARTLIAEQDLDLLLFADVGMDTMTSTLVYSRMAPIQMVTWGHPVTTGSPTIDYFLSSEDLELPDADEHYTEQLIRRPTLGTYYHRPAVPDLDGARAAFGLPDDAHLYACPQTLFKFHPEFDPLLAGILRADPQGVIVLIEGRFPQWTNLLYERFTRTMPDVVNRIRWLPGLPHERFLQLYAISDVALDPTTFGGGNTTYEALAMGTPVITLPGPFLRSRISHALYRKMDYDEPIAASADEYVDKAVRAATDPDYRGQLRAEIARRSPVLFEDVAEISDLEGCFSELLDRAGR